MYIRLTTTLISVKLRIQSVYLIRINHSTQYRIYWNILTVAEKRNSESINIFIFFYVIHYLICRVYKYTPPDQTIRSSADAASAIPFYWFVYFVLSTAACSVIRLSQWRLYTNINVHICDVIFKFNSFLYTYRFLYCYT